MVSDGENVVILSRSRSKLVGDIIDRVIYIVGDISRWDVVAHMTPPRPKGAGFLCWGLGC